MKGTYGEDPATLKLMVNLAVKAYGTPIPDNSNAKKTILLSFYDDAYAQCVQRHFQ